MSELRWPPAKGDLLLDKQTGQKWLVSLEIPVYAKQNSYHGCDLMDGSGRTYFFSAAYVNTHMVTI